MKKYLLYVFGIFIVFLVSISFMDVSTDISDDVMVSTELKTASFFQIGAFLDKETAYDLKQKENAVIEFDGEYYYVYKAILFEKENVNKMIEYLNDSNYYYYIKKRNMNNDDYLKVSELEGIMKTSTSEVAFLRINNNILKEYEAIYENNGND